MAHRLHFLGRDFVGFRNALARQSAAFPEPVEVHATWFDTEPLYERLLSSNDADLALVLTDWLPQLIVAGRLEPLNHRLATDPPAGWPDAWSSSMRRLQVARDGSVYGLAYHDGPMMFLYRGDLFDDPREQTVFAETYGYSLRPPRGWQEFRNIASHFTRPDEGLWGTVLAGYPDGHNNVYDFLIHLWSRGGRLLEADGTPLFGSPAGLSALSFLYELWCVDDVIDPRALGWDSVASGESFAAGNAAMMVNWCGFAALSALPGSPTAGRVRCAPVPRFEGRRGKQVSLSSYWVTSIPVGSRDSELAYRFMRHLAEPAMDRVTSEEGGTGTRLSTWRDPAIRRLAPYYEVMEEVHRYVMSPPPIPEYPAVNTILSAMVDDVITGRVSPAKALTDAERRVLELEFAP